MSRSSANDAHLIQLVRTALGRDSRTRNLPRLNVSSCKFVVTVHGSIGSAEEARAVCEVIRGVPGVREVEDRTRAGFHIRASG